MARVAFCLPDERVWTGGVNYFETVCRTLLAHPDLGYEPLGFCSPHAEPALQRRFEALLGPRLVRDTFLARGRRAGLLGALTLGSNSALAALCVRHDCSVMLESADFFGWRFPCACVAWVPDFQDCHLPQLFSRLGRYRRAWGLRLQLAAGRTVLLSSEDARRDCEHFYPQSRARTVVARFAVAPPLAPGEHDPQVLIRYRLPERFFYLPNQFWVHKNHGGVLEALRLLRERGLNVVVVASGNRRDPRHTGYYEDLCRSVDARGLREHFRFIGNLPRRDVALLMRASLAVLNPSLFEGWSTSVEEGKSLGVRLVLSDLAVHREQVGSGAEFFDPYDPGSIAASLEKVWLEAPHFPAFSEQQQAAAGAARRIREFAEQFTGACKQAIASRRRSGHG